MLSRVLALSTVGFVLACESTEPNALAGTYTATEFTITEPGQQPTNVLAAGGSLTITIAANNSTSGTLMLPASVTDGDALTESMAGTVVVTGNSVEFNQAADTFVRDMTWQIEGNTLVSTALFAGVTVDVTLTRALEAALRGTT